jgi:hypothetical protein
MPALGIGLILIVLFISLAAYYIKKKEVNLEKRGVNIVVFVVSLISLVISWRLFWSIAEYADKYGSSPVLITGGWFWVYMDWILQGLLLVLCIITGFKLIPHSKKE